LRDDDGRIIAAASDYQLASYLLGGRLARSLGARVSDGAARFFQKLCIHARNTFTTADAARGEDVADKTVREWLKELARAGFVEQFEASKGPRPATWKLADDPPADVSAAKLPSVEVICGADAAGATA